MQHSKLLEKVNYSIYHGTQSTPNAGKIVSSQVKSNIFI